MAISGDFKSALVAAHISKSGLPSLFRVCRSIIPWQLNATAPSQHARAKVAFPVGKRTLSSHSLGWNSHLCSKYFLFQSFRKKQCSLNGNSYKLFFSKRDFLQHRSRIFTFSSVLLYVFLSWSMITLLTPSFVPFPFPMILSCSIFPQSRKLKKIKK